MDSGHTFIGYFLLQVQARRGNSLHLYGTPAKIKALADICQRFKVPILEDAAESLGATVDGQYTGTFGQFGVYSFNGNKIITTSGGGALVSNEKALIDKARFLATQARDPAPHYQHTEIGYNYRLSNILAGIGRGQMRVLDQRILQRRDNYNRYKDYFQNWNDKGFCFDFPNEPKGSFCNRWLTTMLVDPIQNKGLNRETIRLSLAKENIEARPLWKPMHMQPVFQDELSYLNGISEQLFDIGLCLPSGTNMTDEDWKRIFSTLDKLLASA